MQVIVWDSFNGVEVFDASTPERKARAVFYLLKQFLEAQVWHEQKMPEPLGFTAEDVMSFPASIRQAANEKLRQHSRAVSTTARQNAIYRAAKAALDNRDAVGGLVELLAVDRQGHHVRSLVPTILPEQ
jgi:hypothetical protein